MEFRVKNTSFFRNFFLVAVVACLPSLSLAYYPQSIDVNTSNFSEIITYSDIHPFTSARNFTTLSITGLPSECQNGIYYNASTNNESHSLILSVYVADATIVGKRITIEFDRDQSTSPWGASNTCAMTNVRIRR